MGAGRFDADDWKTYATTNSYSTKTTSAIFTSRHLDKDLDPKGVIRESCDSVDNPESTPLIVALDVTGSMGHLAGVIAKEGLPVLATEIYNRKPIKDPHILFMGIGDVEHDRAPIQATQFEAAAVPLAAQLEKLYLEGGGGGNRYESYAAAWYFAAKHTKIDSFSKRGKKGYLFTIGDELPTPRLTKQHLKEFLGDDEQVDITIDNILTLVSKEWEIFHIIVDERLGGTLHSIDMAWKEVLGQRIIHLKDHTKIAEVIVSALQVAEGEDHDTVSKSWDGSTALVVKEATKSLRKLDNKGLTKSSAHAGGVVTL